MAYLVQSSTILGDTKKITISMWARANYSGTSNIVNDLFNFGADTWQSGDVIWNPCRVRWSITNAGSTTLSFSFHGQPQSLDAYNYTLQWIQSPDPGWYPMFDAHNTWTPYTAFNISNVPGRNTWMHFLMALDLTNQSTANYVAGGGLYGGTFLSGPQAFVRLNGNLATLTQGNFGPPSIVNGGIWSWLTSADVSLGPWTYSVPVVNNDLYHNYIPSYSMSINGYNFGVPHTASGETTWETHTPVDLADVQIWLGQFINPSTDANYSKFVQVVGGKGYPVNPSIATSAFGQQTILFKGKSSDNSFFFNRGTGGSFSKIGTTADFTPTPSYT